MPDDDSDSEDSGFDIDKIMAFLGTDRVIVEVPFEGTDAEQQAFAGDLKSRIDRELGAWQARTLFYSCGLRSVSVDLTGRDGVYICKLLAPMLRERYPTTTKFTVTDIDSTDWKYFSLDDEALNG